MLISKYKDKAGKTNVAILVHKNFIKETKNKDYVRITISEDFMVGLDEKKQVKLSEVLDIAKLVDNTK